MKSHKSIAIAFAVFTLSGCVTNANKPMHASRSLADVELTSALENVRDDSLSAPYVRAALVALEDGDFIEAQKGINRALKFDPTNSQLHYLNGLIYHLRANTGDASQREFAAIGYDLSLQYDPSNYWAAYQLGHLNFGDQQYRKAQESFAYSLLFAPNDPTLLKALATASYHAQDLKTASEAISKAEQLSPEDPVVLRLATLIHAAGGQFGSAWDTLNRYSAQTISARPSQTAYLTRRVDDWKRVYDRRGVQLAQSTTNVLGTDGSSIGVSPDSDTSDSGNGDSSDTDSTSTNPASKPSSPPQMTMVDVVIIRSEERLATDKGVNLLNGLTATLGGTTFAYTGTRTATSATSGNTLTNVFTYAPTLSVAATYSLNIFNDNNDHNEVLARPSLIALDGKKSEFFTGAVFHVEIAGAAGSEGSVEEVPVGIKLDVTPKFMGNDTIQMDVSAARAFIETRSANAGFNNFTQVTKTVVTANVAMKFGETMVISGLSEKETEVLRDGVPGLQDIPGIQYLFSHEDTLDFTKSVLILLTPRQPHYTHADGTPKKNQKVTSNTKTPQPSLKELKNRPDWFQQASNLDAVFAHLADSVFYKEFRAGDVTLEHWDTRDSLADRIKRAVSYIYF